MITNDELVALYEAIPKPKIRLMSTPLLGRTKPETWAIRKGTHDDVWKQIARLIGLSEYVFAPETYSRRRHHFKELADATGAPVTLHINPWWVGKDDFIHPTYDPRSRLMSIRNWLAEWNDLDVRPESILINDESVAVTADNERAILQRSYRLAEVFSSADRTTKQYWYNHDERKYVDGPRWHTTHEHTPSDANGCSLYYDDILRVEGTLQATPNPLVPWISLTHAWQYEWSGLNAWFKPPGAWKRHTGERATNFYRQFGEMMKTFNVEAAVVYAPELSEEFATNLASFVDGING